MKRFSSISLGFVVVIGAANACTSATEDMLYGCDPDAIRPAPACIKQDSGGEDAGTADAASDVTTEESSLTEEPGLDPAGVFPASACQTECVPEAEGPLAIGWSNTPLVVWFGPRAELADKLCPDGVSYEKLRGFDKLVASPAKCDACACLPDGDCAGLPETIEIRSGSCNASNVETTPFDGPLDWNGACTVENAIPAGKLCNGVPCAQSVSTSALPAPSNESCIPTAEKPLATLEKHEWLEGVLACGAKDLKGTCAVPPEHCVGLLDKGWRRCVAHVGKQEVCPGNYDDLGPYWVYQDNPIDTRGCSECVCGAPKNGICTGSLSVYEDSSCSKDFIKLPLSSIDPSCGTITPSGRAVGGKTISVSYQPGTCAVSGGEPIGTVVPNDTASGDTVTICCRVTPAPKQPTY